MGRCEDFFGDIEIQKIDALVMPVGTNLFHRPDQGNFHSLPQGLPLQLPDALVSQAQLLSHPLQGHGSVRTQSEPHPDHRGLTLIELPNPLDDPAPGTARSPVVFSYPRPTSTSRTSLQVGNIRPLRCLYSLHGLHEFLFRCRELPLAGGRVHGLSPADRISGLTRPGSSGNILGIVAESSEELSAPPWLGPPDYLWPRRLDRRQGSLRVEERAGNTDRCAKKVNLLQAVFFGIPMNDSTFSSENRDFSITTGNYRRLAWWSVFIVSVREGPWASRNMSSAIRPLMVG